MGYREKQIENAIRKHLATNSTVKLLGCDVVCMQDRHESATNEAIVVDAYNTERLNTGCKGRGDQLQTSVVITVVGVGEVVAIGDNKTLLLSDADKTKLYNICGIVEDAIDDMQPSDILSDSGCSTIYGLVWNEPSQTLNNEQIVGMSLPSFKVIYEK